MIRTCMRPGATLATLAAVALVTVLPARAAAQALGARIEGAPSGHVQFRFAARPGVCGNGRTYIQSSPGNFHGSYNSDMMRSEACAPGDSGTGPT